MSLPLSEQLKATFGDLENFTPDKLHSLIQETLRVFRTIQVKVHSTDEAEREAGVKLALELKEILEKQSEDLCRKVGMDPVQLAQFFENGSDELSEQQSEVLETTKKELDEFKKELNLPKDRERTVLRVPRKTKRSQKVWVAG